VARRMVAKAANSDGCERYTASDLTHEQWTAVLDEQQLIEAQFKSQVCVGRNESTFSSSCSYCAILLRFLLSHSFCRFSKPNSRRWRAGSACLGRKPSKASSGASWSSM
jgi:hypothetical protein